jgi:hypothetical protein
MTVAEKLTTIAENEQKVFDAGKKAEYDRFWDAFQENGERYLYNYGFAYEGWNADTYAPKYPITIRGKGNGNYVYLYNFFVVDTMVEISVLQNSDRGQPGETIGLFQNAINLKTIRKLTFDETTIINNVFWNCPALENLTMGGTIGQNGFDVSQSPKLTHDSLMSIINCLEAKAEGTWTVTLGATNLAKLTDAEKAIATQKGWTLA